MSSFGSGSSQWATGTTTNAATFGSGSLFGPHLASRGQSMTTPGAITATAAGDTSKLGYSDPTEGHGISGSPMQPVAPCQHLRQLTASKGMMKPDSTPMGLAAKKLGPQPQPGQTPEQVAEGKGRALVGAAARGVGNAINAGRNASFGYGSAEARTGQEMPGGVFSAAGAANDLDEDVQE